MSQSAPESNNTAAGTLPPRREVQAVATRVQTFLAAGTGMPYEIGYLGDSMMRRRLSPADLQVMANAALFAANNPPLIIERTPVQIDFESTAAKAAVDITGALLDANAPFCHPDGELMSQTEQIAWLGKRAALADTLHDALAAVLAEAQGAATPSAASPRPSSRPVLAKVQEAVGAYVALGELVHAQDIARASGIKLCQDACGE